MFCPNSPKVFGICYMGNVTRFAVQIYERGRYMFSYTKQTRNFGTFGTKTRVFVCNQWVAVSQSCPKVSQSCPKVFHDRCLENRTYFYDKVVTPSMFGVPSTKHSVLRTLPIAFGSANGAFGGRLLVTEREALSTQTTHTYVCP